MCKLTKIEYNLVAKRAFRELLVTLIAVAVGIGFVRHSVFYLLLALLIPLAVVLCPLIKKYKNGVTPSMSCPSKLWVFIRNIPGVAYAEGLRIMHYVSAFASETAIAGFVAAFAGPDHPGANTYLLIIGIFLLALAVKAVLHVIEPHKENPAPLV